MISITYFQIVLFLLSAVLYLAARERQRRIVLEKRFKKLLDIVYSPDADSSKTLHTAVLKSITIDIDIVCSNPPGAFQAFVKKKEEFIKSIELARQNRIRKMNNENARTVNR